MGYKFGREIKPDFDFEKQTLKFTSEIDKIIGTRVEEEINFKNECVRKALIALGWTPPSSSSNSEIMRGKNESL